MESIIGIRFAVEPTAENIKKCSEYSGAFFRSLVKDHQITYNRILYPYADALSLSGKTGTESTRIFGTHMLLRNISAHTVYEAMRQALPAEAPEWLPTEFAMSDGAVESCDIKKFLTRGTEDFDLPRTGDFGGMLAGFLPHWRIRECSRIFASFSEMAYRRSGGKIAGLFGGSLILTPECDCPEALADIFSQKTGVSR